MLERDEDPPSIVDALRVGDEWALAEIYARWSPLVYSLGLGSLGSPTEAEKVTQRVFVQAWTARRTFDPRLVALPTWLLELTRGQIAGARRARNGPERPGTPVTPASAAAETVETADLAERLMLADEMWRLDPVPGQALRMALFEELSHVEIAERLRLPPGIVPSLIRRGLLGLRGRLGVLADAH